ncbi:anti-sigma factor family protein [Falsiroseomonas sp.]|uniref:anti-sigma factor family protein n=1 Tax=Falsiroseomonas sp. TaxID=2870721 RepID=UPI003562D42F
MAEPEAPIGEDDLHALMDGRLSPARAPAVQRYLEARPEAAARLRAMITQRDALRCALAFKAAEPIPPRLRLANLRAARRRAVAGQARVAAAAAVLLLTGGGLGWLVRGMPEAASPPVASAPAALHLLLAEASPRVQAASAAEADLGSWLADRLGTPMPLPDLAAFGFGAAAAWVMPGAEGRTAVLHYIDGDGAALSIWRRPAPDPAPHDLRCNDEPGGLVTYRWSDGRHLFAVTAALPRERLRPIALAVERALKAPPPGGMMIAGLSRRPCQDAAG